MFSLDFNLIISVVIISSSLIVVFSSNAIYSVIGLIIAYCGSAALFIKLEAEFLALLLIIVYVGAIAVLFLFVIIMLNLKTSVNTYKVPFLVSTLTFFGTLQYIYCWELFTEFPTRPFREYYYRYATAHDQIYSFANVLFDDTVLCLICGGVILLIAMIGAIVLSTKFTPGSRLSSEQISRNFVTKYIC